MFKSLDTSSHVLIRNKPIKASLDPPYLGPYKVVTRPHELFYNIEIPNARGVIEVKAVSTERLKPAFFIPDDFADRILMDNPQTHPKPQIPPQIVITSPQNVNSIPSVNTTPSTSSSTAKSRPIQKKKVIFRDDHSYSREQESARMSKK